MTARTPAAPTPPRREGEENNPVVAHAHASGTRYYLGAPHSILICLSGSSSVGSSVWPAGNDADFKMNATVSAYSLRLIRPGASCGIEMRMRSKRSPTERPSHEVWNSWPFNAGALSWPARSVPWQLEQFI